MPHDDTKPAVRTYRKGDESAIARLFNLCFGQGGIYIPFTPELWRWRYLRCPDFDPNSVFLLEESGRIVSSIVMTYVKMSVNGIPRQVALIGDVSTHPGYRGQGYATKLMKQAIELALKRGCWAIHLTADPEGNAIRIYHGLGFRTFAKPIIMVSTLRREDGLSPLGLVPTIPILLIDSFLSLRSTRRFSGNARMRLVNDEQARPFLLARHQTHEQRNGCLMMGEDYARWFCSHRPEGGVSVFEVESSSETAGIVTVSSIRTTLWGKSISMAAISNPLIPEDRRDPVTLTEALSKVREFAANRLGCMAASIAIDSRDTVTIKACQKARFFRTVSLASMIHPLGDAGKIHEIRKGFWSQPLEAAKPVP